MKWKGRRKSTNVDDRRFRGNTRRFRVPSIQTILFLLQIIKPLLKSKFGIFILIVGGFLYFSGFNPLSLESISKSDTSQNRQADDEKAAFISTVLADTEDIWRDIFAKAGYRYTEPKLVLYRGSTSSGCGYASAQMGPFYCPTDQTIYIDLSFYDELELKYGASGDFAQAYILAHEVGHHVQNLEGTLQKVQNAKQQSFGKKAQNALQVRVELQADCYSGIWANRAHKTKDILEEGDIEEALNAASSIGDDRLQKQATGYVSPDSFTHGSSKQRMSWFLKGFKSGDLKSCNTFKL